MPGPILPPSPSVSTAARSEPTGSAIAPTAGRTSLTTSLDSGLGNNFTTSIPGRMMFEYVLTPVPDLPGDYNHNGIVDAADYVVWRKGLGTTYTQADYDVWRATSAKPPAAARA